MVDKDSVLLEKECYSASFRLHTNLLSVAKGLTYSRTGSYGGRGSGSRRDELQQGYTNASDCLKQTCIIRKERKENYIATCLCQWFA